MDLSFNHIFAEHDARLDCMLSTLRRERKKAEGRSAREIADQALIEIEQSRFNALDSLSSFELLRWSDISDCPYEQLMRAFKRAMKRLNPVLDAMQAFRNSNEDRRALRSLLDFETGQDPWKPSKSALLVWILARNTWRKFLARSSSQIAIRRGNGFFGAGKVDGRNTP